MDRELDCSVSSVINFTLSIKRLSGAELFFVGVCRYRVFGDPPSQRSAEDIAFAVARFFSVGGSMVNYYMVPSSNQPTNQPTCC